VSLRKILGRIEEELSEREEFKDELYEAMRKATRFSKQAIFAVHKGKLREAGKLLIDAEKFFTELDRIPLACRELVYAGIVDSAFQEYAEAHVLLNLVKSGKFVDPEKIRVPSTSYLLGLADVVGELRRRTLDSLRRGNLKSAEKSLENMEFIHDALMGLEKAPRSVSELRRKSDVARRVIEATRGDVTLEVRRNSLERSIRYLEKTIKAKAKTGS
jgi:translin